MDPILYLPGLLNDAALWQAQMLALPGRHQVANLHEQDSITALAAHTLAEAPAQFALVGLSMGGYVALEIMRQAPERVTRLALFDTSARADTPEQGERRRALLALAKSGKFKGVTPRLLPQLIHPSRLHDPAVTQPILDMAARVGQMGFRNQQTAIMGRIDSRLHLPAIRCPVLIAVGADDQLTPPSIAQEMAGLIPGSRLAVIPQCGHLPPLEQPEQTTTLLRTWLHNGS